MRMKDNKDGLRSLEALTVQLARNTMCIYSGSAVNEEGAFIVQ